MKKHFLIPIIVFALTACGGAGEEKKTIETEKPKDKADSKPEQATEKQKKEEKQEKEEKEADKKLPEKPVDKKVDDDLTEPDKK